MSETSVYEPFRGERRATFSCLNLFFSILGNYKKEDQRLYNLLYRKSKLESVNETSALLSGFAIVSNLFILGISSFSLTSIYISGRHR